MLAVLGLISTFERLAPWPLKFNPSEPKVTASIMKTSSQAAISFQIILSSFHTPFVSFAKEEKKSGVWKGKEIIWKEIHGPSLVNPLLREYVNDFQLPRDLHVKISALGSCHWHFSTCGFSFGHSSFISTTIGKARSTVEIKIRVGQRPGLPCTKIHSLTFPPSFFLVYRWPRLFILA